MAITLSSFFRRVPRWVWLVVIPIGVIVLALGILAALPVAADPPLAEEEWGAGAVNILPATSGLLREWPDIGEDFDPELARLGYQLFFDPILSGDNTRSCASCHHPDWAFSEPRPRAIGPDGTETIRHTPTLWNVAYASTLFWDGRAESLEAQALESLGSAQEMNQSIAALTRELEAIDAYDQQFNAIFADGITQDSIAAALAAFERTLISDSAPFDRYAAGDFEAITAQQRRGLATFRSAGTRCFECHIAPTFTDNGFAVIGVPDSGLGDIGRGTVQSGLEYAFRTPTLRNVALRGPYMHNGSLATLEDVIAHYSSGAQGFDLATVDRRVAGFNLTEQETEDLVAFLFALTDETIPERFWSAGYVDETGRIVIPASVPSGLPTISSLANPARERLAELSASPDVRPACNREAAPTTLIVPSGGSIQAVVDCAVPGDTILVEPGVYHERVVIDISGITLRGRVEEPTACPLRGNDGRFPEGDDAPNWPVLDGDINGDGTPDLTDAVIASGNDFRMEYFVMRNYLGNGALVEGVTGVTLRHLFASNTGLYGVYPVHSTGVLVECSVGTQIRDAAIYVGQSRDIIVRGNLAYDSVVGVEVENSANADVYDNESWGNTGGLLAILLPNLQSLVSTNINVHDNYVYDNNRSRGDARPGSVVTLVPIGTGIFVMASDNTQIYDNRIEDNDSFGVAVVSLYQAFDPDEIFTAGGVYSENVQVYGNSFSGNGQNPDAAVTEAGLSGADVLWDATGGGNTFDQPGANLFPPVLPERGMPMWVQRIIYQVWNIVARLL